MVKPDIITDRFIQTVCARLSANKRVRRTLPVWGRVHIDRQLPFLCLYRRPVVGSDAGTDRLVTSEASYLLASGIRKLRDSLAKLAQEVAHTLGDQFGAVLVLELWTGDRADNGNTNTLAASKPRFRIIAPKDRELDPLIDTLRESLGKIKVSKQRAEVGVLRGARWCPRQFLPILPASVAKQLGYSVIGLEVCPIYRNPVTDDLYPLVLRDLRRGLTRALRRTFFEFARSQTTHRPEHFHMLGRRAVIKAVWEVDRQMAEVSDSFDFLLQVTPMNAERAWQFFQKSRFERLPALQYRPLPADPILLKRRLYEAAIERVEDPALFQLFREKQEELDRKITMLVDVNTKRFIYGSMQVFGGVEDELVTLAEELLDGLPPRMREDAQSQSLDAASFGRLAQKEINYYGKFMPEIKGRIYVRDDIVSGSMVSHGSLLIARHTRVPTSRAAALIQHEVGTHLLTYYNGRVQPFRQLYSGLAGYEALQEGLAVLSEHLVGGLSRPRLRLLAGRVVAVRCMIDGATFVETFQKLHSAYGFAQRIAFTMALRVFRGGGLTKDAVYLRGLVEVLKYLKRGGELEPLFVGKFAVEHVPIIKELQWRKVLKQVPLRPRYLDAPEAGSRLERIRAGLTVSQLINRQQP